jgi:hypothetical protein
MVAILSCTVHIQWIYCLVTYSAVSSAVNCAVSGSPCTRGGTEVKSGGVTVPLHQHMASQTPNLCNAVTVFAGATCRQHMDVIVLGMEGEKTAYRVSQMQSEVRSEKTFGPLRRALI